MPSTGAAFPRLRVKAGAEATVQAVLPGHIYTIDGLLDPAECGQVLKWAKSLQLEAPKPAKRDEAERTACECISQLINMFSWLRTGDERQPSS